MESKLALPRRSGRRARAGGTKKGSLGADNEGGWKVCEALVIGGGIAGVSCAQELSRLSPASQIILVSQTEVLREVLFSNRLTENLEDVSITESTMDELKVRYPNITVIVSRMSQLDHSNKVVRLMDGQSLRYNSLCVCTGAIPRLLCSPRAGIITVRDSMSVENLTGLLKSASRVVVIGNGGIAMEMAHELHYCETDWIIRDEYIGSPFFDATASDFLLEIEGAGRTVEVCSRSDTPAGFQKVQQQWAASKDCYVSREDVNDDSRERVSGPSGHNHGSAVGPHLRRRLTTGASHEGGTKQPLHLHPGQQVVAIYDHSEEEWAFLEDCYQPFESQDDHDLLRRVTQSSQVRGQGQGSDHRFSVATSTGAIIQCDCVVAAIGVVPCTQGCEGLVRDEDGALRVNELMQTSDPHVYAAGDCCTYSPAAGALLQRGKTPWFQMKLWAQARVMGVYAAQCINERANSLLVSSKSVFRSDGSEYEGMETSESARNDWAFHLFAHVTNFFGMKVVLLGRFNGQGLGKEAELAIKRVMVSEKRLKDSNTHADKNEASNSAARVGTGRGKVPAIDFASKKRGRACDCCTGDEEYAVARHAAGLKPDGREDSRAEDLVDPRHVEMAVRTTPGVEYIKLVLRGGKVVGALLIGETDLEETFENLILNRVDVSHLGSQLLDPEHDLEDYFD